MKNIKDNFALYALIIGLFLTFSHATQAATYTVNSILDPGVVAGCDAIECTLREAIVAANATADDDIINFDPIVFNTAQTITLNGTRLTIANNGKLTINGTGANQLTVSGNDVSQVFFINTGTTAEINNLTVSNANGGNQNGGGIANSGTLTLTNLIISNSRTTAGGGGVTNFGILTLNSLTVSGNSGANGGGITNFGSTLTVNNSIISGNTGRDGGGIFNNGTTEINNSTVRDNTASIAGGGLFNNRDRTLTLNNSTVSGNVSNGAQIQNGTGGGGIANGSGVGGTGGGTLTVNNSTISGNSATADGGGIFAQGANSVTTLNNSTISNNTAVRGGGIRNNGRPFTINNSIIANSTSNSTNADCSGFTNISASYSLIESSLDCVGGTNLNNLTGDPNLGPLQNNGGSTLTHALLAGSIAIDKGNSTLTTDQRGFPRPVDNFTIPNAMGGNGSDIGAFEVQAPTAASVTIGGRVSSGKRGLARATVYLTDQNGSVRTARTNSFGYYQFEDIEVGQTLIVNVFHKQYQFDPQVVSLNEAMENLNFTPQNSVTKQR